MCTRKGFTIPRIINVIILGISICLHCSGIILPVWSHFRYVSSGFEAHSEQGLWSLNIIKDEFNAYPPREKIDDGWKETIIILETSAVSVAVIGYVLLLVQTTVNKILTQKMANSALRLVCVIFFLAAGLESLSGILLYGTQKYRVFSVIAKDPDNKIPIYSEESDIGLYCTAASSALYFLSVVTEVADLLIDRSFKTGDNAEVRTNKSTFKARRVQPIKRPHRHEDFDF